MVAAQIVFMGVYWFSPLSLMGIDFCTILIFLSLIILVMLELYVRWMFTRVPSCWLATRKELIRMSVIVVFWRVCRWLASSSFAFENIKQVVFNVVVYRLPPSLSGVILLGPFMLLVQYLVREILSLIENLTLWEEAKVRASDD